MTRPALRSVPSTPTEQPNALGVEMRFLPCLEGEGAFPVGLRSSTLTKDQFSGLLELLYAYGAKHGVQWSDPAERKAA